MATLVVTLRSAALPDTYEIIKRVDPIYSPTTASITALGLYDVERHHGAVYLEGSSDFEIVVGDWRCKERTERNLLEDFWEGANSYDTFVTFNGRSFAMPFLLHRSVSHDLRPSVEIAQQRYLTKQAIPYHVDLMDELTLYGGMQRTKLDDFCSLYGISESGVGKECAGGFRTETTRTLATEVINETLAITALYEKWLKYLAPNAFINKLEF